MMRVNFVGCGSLMLHAPAPAQAPGHRHAGRPLERRRRTAPGEQRDLRGGEDGPRRPRPGTGGFGGGHRRPRARRPARVCRDPDDGGARATADGDNARGGGGLHRARSRGALAHGLGSRRAAVRVRRSCATFPARSSGGCRCEIEQCLDRCGDRGRGRGDRADRLARPCDHGDSRYLRPAGVRHYFRVCRATGRVAQGSATAISVSRPLSGSRCSRGLTRRTVLAGAAAAGAATLVSPASRLASALERRSSIFSRWVGSLEGESRRARGATALRDGRRPVGRAGRRPDRGANARPAPAAGAGGRSPPSSGTAPTARCRRRPLVGDPIWTGSADFVQLRGLEAGRRRATAVRERREVRRIRSRRRRSRWRSRCSTPARASRRSSPARRGPARRAARGAARVRRGEAGVRPPHGQPQRLQRRRGPRDAVCDVPVPPLRPRLERHWLQLRDRPLRPDLGGPQGRDRPGRGRRPGGWLQPGIDRGRGAGHVQRRGPVARGDRCARAAARVEALAARGPDSAGT